MISNRLGIVFCLLLVLGGAGCDSGRGAANSVRALPASLPTASPPRGGMPSLPAVDRLSAEDDSEFLIQQPGASFATDLSSNKCAVVGNTAEFSPQWSYTLPDAAGREAFAFYRLTYNPQTLPVTLSLAWTGPAPADANCWIGLSDWTGNVWRWQQPTAGQLVVANPTQFVDASQHCYVALVMLGQSSCKLATIGFGTPPPPPTGDGYTLFAPLSDKSTYLIDMDGTVVKKWTSAYTAGATSELLENGHMMRAATVTNPNFSLGGISGRLEEYDWAGNLVWYYTLSTPTQCTHHDFTRLPNGNILLLVSNRVPRADFLAAGRNPATLGTGTSNVYVDSVIEIQPTLPNGGNVVWEWHLSDHLVQNFDNTKANFGDPAAHPELVDINYPVNVPAGDWSHLNCVAYNPHLDQVMLTSLYFSEIWVIDHSTTTAEATGHSGGNLGHGGDLLYRWGNPQTYGGGTAADEQFYGCHNGHWIAAGLDGAGDILVFKNQTNAQAYSQVVQLTPPLNPDGSYALTGSAYGPAAPNWFFQGTPIGSFSSALLGSVQRLPGGDTFVDSGIPGKFFVVDPAGTIKWTYQNTFPQGSASPVFRALRYTPDYPGLAGLQ